MRSENGEAPLWPLCNLLHLTLVTSCLSYKYSLAAILTEVPRGFPQYTKANVETILHLGQDRFLQNPSQFFTHHITIVTGSFPNPQSLKSNSHHDQILGSENMFHTHKHYRHNPHTEKCLIFEAWKSALLQMGSDSHNAECHPTLSACVALTSVEWESTCLWSYIAGQNGVTVNFIPKSPGFNFGRATIYN
jgi:hypothetical protein